MTPLVSIIIPVYNIADYLRPCLDSVLQQSYANLEILIINDASPDTSAVIISEYAQKDQRIKVLTHETNKGLGESRNAGIRHAVGKYIFFLDGDDLLEPRAIASLTRYAEQYQTDIIFGNFTTFYDNGHPDELWTFGWKSTFGYYRPFRIQGDIHYENFIFTDIIDVVWIKLYRKDFLMRENIRFYPIIHEDIPFSIETYLKAATLVAIPDNVLLYRKRNAQQNLSLSDLSQKEHLSFYAFNITAQMLQKIGYLHRVQAGLIQLILKVFFHKITTQPNKALIIAKTKECLQHCPFKVRYLTLPPGYEQLLRMLLNDNHLNEISILIEEIRLLRIQGRQAARQKRQLLQRGMLSLLKSSFYAR